MRPPAGWWSSGDDPSSHPDVRHPADRRQSLDQTGSVEESGVSSAVMGNPINSVPGSPTSFYEYGVTPEAGHVSCPESFIKAIPFNPGDTVVALFDTLGEVTFYAE